MRHNIDNEKNDLYAHKPVLYREVIRFMGDSAGKGGKCAVDCTLGEGGHSELMLHNFPDLRIIGFERDSDILAVAKERLAPFAGRIEFVNDNFSNIGAHLSPLKGMISGFLYDFGISSFHFDRSGRGFGIQNDERLDMRLSLDQPLDAWQVVNKYPESRLSEIIANYGEERWAKRVARYICRRREEGHIDTTGELAGLVLRAIPARYHVRNIHPATRVFQAIRIEVNGELDAIEKSLYEAVGFLAPEGRCIAISFHSLEDRIVKNVFRNLARGCTCGNEPKFCTCMHGPYVKVLTSKPIVPEEGEVMENKRARSAKMRVCEAVAS